MHVHTHAETINKVTHWPYDVVFDIKTIVIQPLFHFFISLCARHPSYVPWSYLYKNIPGKDCHMTMVLTLINTIAYSYFLTLLNVSALCDLVESLS